MIIFLAFLLHYLALIFLLGKEIFYDDFKKQSREEPERRFNQKLFDQLPGFTA